MSKKFKRFIVMPLAGRWMVDDTWIFERHNFYDLTKYRATQLARELNKANECRARYANKKAKHDNTQR